MKSKSLIGALMLVATAGLITSCGKSKTVEETTAVSTAKPTHENKIIHIGSPKDKDQHNQNGMLSRGSGTVVYYSYDADNSVRYKMTLVTNSTGDVTLTRETTSSSTTTVSINGVLSGLTYTASTDGLDFQVPTTQKYFAIPFKPGEGVWQYNGGTEVWLSCACSAINCGLYGYYDETLEIYIYGCYGSVCGVCKFTDRDYMTGATTTAFVSPSGGFIMIEANSVTVSE